MVGVNVKRDGIHRTFLCGIVIFLVYVLYHVNAAAALPEIRVAVLPFDIKSAGPFSYVGPAAEEILTSRLASDKISVIDVLDVRRTTDGKPLSDLREVRELARKLNADFVVTGNVAAEGKCLTINMDLLKADSESPLYTFALSPESLDRVLPGIEDFATQAADQILNGPKSVAKDVSNTNSGQDVPIELPQEDTAGNNDIMLSRMHPDRLVRTSITNPSSQEAQTSTLSAEEQEALALLPKYPPLPDKPDESVHSKKDWFSWIKKPWAGKKEPARNAGPASTLPYPLPGQESVKKKEQVAIHPQASNTEQPVPSDGPIWQWY